MKAEAFIRTDGQLSTTNIILSYTPTSMTFQVPKCVVKARDPRLHQINVATMGFLIFGPIPEGVLNTNPIPEGIPRVEASSSSLIVKENEEEEEEEEEGEIVEVSDSEDNFDVFNQSESLAEESQIQEASPVPDIMGIQRKPRTGLLDVMESTSGSKVPEKNA